MRRLWIGLAAATALAATAGAALADTTLDVLYANVSVFKDIQEKLAADFERQHPDIHISFWTPAQTYDEGTAQILRGSLVGQVPDVYFNGLNQVRVLVTQNIAVPFDQFVAGKDDWARLGYIPSMVSLGEIEGKTYGLPFAVSTPVMYVNEDLLKKAGGSIENFPKDWDGILALGKKMADPANGITGFLYGYDNAGNFLYQALVNSDGGTMGSADGCKLAFDGPAGKWALAEHEAFFKAGMPNMGWQQGRPAFAAGKVGIYVESSATVALMEKSAGGKFTVRTLPFPLPAADGKLPAGGAVAMILAKDPAKQKAAWEYIKFVTGPEGQTAMANATGYAPGNQIAVDDPKLLKGYYEARPNFATGVKQLPVMTGWYNWGGPNSVKIVDVIQNYINDVVAGRRTADATMPLMVADVQKLLPASCGQ